MHFRFFPALKNFAELSDRNLRRWVAQAEEVATKLAADPAAFIAEARKTEASFSADDLVAEMTAGVEAMGQPVDDLGRLPRGVAQRPGVGLAVDTDDAAEVGGGEGGERWTDFC